MGPLFDNLFWKKGKHCSAHAVNKSDSCLDKKKGEYSSTIPLSISLFGYGRNKVVLF